MDSSIFCCCCENSDFTIYYIQNAWSASSCCIWEYGSWTSADFIFVCIRCIPYRLRKEDEEEKDDLENRIEVVMVSSPNRTDLVFPKVWPCLFHQVFRTQTVIVAVLLPICLFGSCPSFFQFPSFLLLSGWMGRWWDCVRSCLQRSHRRSRSERKSQSRFRFCSPSSAALNWCFALKIRLNFILFFVFRKFPLEFGTSKARVDKIHAPWKEAAKDSCLL